MGATEGTIVIAEPTDRLEVSEDFEWVPLQDAATMWPGVCWWDVKARVRRDG